MTQSLRTTARLAGALYLLLALLAFFGLMYVPQQYFVKDNHAETMRRLLANEQVFRFGIWTDLASQVIFVFLVLVLYRLFRPVQEHWSRVMVALVLVSVPIVFVSEACNLAAVAIARKELLVGPGAREEWVWLFLRLYDYGILVAEIFWGLWLIPFGGLMYRSGFMPRILGILLILGGLSYVLESSKSILFPDVSFSFPRIYSLAEVATILWLLIRGTTKNDSL